MNKLLLGITLLIVALFSSSLYAAQGEWWELTVKMEMEGMPFAMPAQTSKICMPKGGQSDPSNTQSKDSNCKMTDVNHSGNTVKFKGTCVDKGETMNISGETSHDANSLKSNVKMSGKSRGENMNMAMSSSGKRVGGSCDTGQVGKEVQAKMDKQMAEVCSTSNFNAEKWIGSSSRFIGVKGNKPLCPGKVDEMCKVLRHDVPLDLKLYQQLRQSEKDMKEYSVVKACNLNNESMLKTLCKSNAKRGPLSFLDANCPTEAKAFRELQRKRRDCEGRGFTGDTYNSSMKKCMGGEIVEESAAEERPAKKARKVTQENSNSSDGSSEAVHQGAKALKGILGF